MDDFVKGTLSMMRIDLATFEAQPAVGALDALVGRLSGAIDALVGRVIEAWLDELRSAWWPLEYVNATVLGDGRQQLTTAETASVSLARDEFLALLAEY